MPTYTAQHVANFFLDCGEKDNIPISPLKLIKLVYIAYGWNMALTNERLFEEPIEAWRHGPVIPSLYHEFKHFGSNPISSKAEDVDLDTYELVVPRVPTTDAQTNFVLNKVWAAYKHFRAWDLRQKTHEPDSPWNRVYAEGKKDALLRDDDIRAHYQGKIRTYIDEARKVVTTA
jgi:uncharacterized phage-associated protein